MSTTKKTKKLSKETRKLIKAWIMHEGYKQSIRLPDKTLLESEVMDFMSEMFLVWLSEERKISKEAFVKLDSDAQEAIVEEFTIFAMALGMVSGS